MNWHVDCMLLVFKKLAGIVDTLNNPASHLYIINLGSSLSVMFHSTMDCLYKIAVILRIKFLPLAILGVSYSI